MSDRKGALHSLERNRFFYGKVMDVRQWRMDQDYSIEARNLLAHFGLGVGVLSGLDIELGNGGASVLVRAGVAIDALGTTIVVPNDVVLKNPNQPTDCLGKPEGEPVTDGTVTLELCYHECLTEPVSALACGCDTFERCEPSVICERFLLRLLAFWPPNGMLLRGQNDDDELRQWANDFREVPHLELTFEATLEVDKLGAIPIDDWIRLWWLADSNDGFFPRRLPLSWNGPWANPHLGVPGTTVGVRIQDLPFPDLQSDRPNHFISVLHGDGMPLDADFAGLVLDGVTVGQAAIDALWQNDQWPPGTLSAPPTPAALSDGNQGGTVTAYFDYAERL